MLWSTRSLGAISSRFSLVLFMNALRSLSVVVFVTAVVMYVGYAIMVPLAAREPEPKTIPKQESDEIIKAWFHDALKRSPKDMGSRPLHKVQWMLTYTTWLPSEWPPSTKTVWTRYAYALDVALDGVSGVSAPFARMERRPGGGEKVAVVSMAEKLKRIATHPVRPHGGWRYTLEDERRILDTALALTRELPQGARATQDLVSYFRSWRLGSVEIAAHVTPQHQAFFDWLERQGQAVPLPSK